MMTRIGCRWHPKKILDTGPVDAGYSKVIALGIQYLRSSTRTETGQA